MNIMTIRRAEMDERNLKNRKNNSNITGCFEKKKAVKSQWGELLNQEKPTIDYSDFNKFIEHIKNTKTKKNKMDLMLEFINQQATEINKTIM